MSKVIRITVDDPVSVNGAYVPIARGRLVLSAAARDYKDKLGWLARAAMSAGDHELITGHVALTITMYGKLDIDNPLKLTHDALKKIVWNDDRQIIEEHLYRHEKSPAPRLELEIKEVA